jgi:hypothetical protein
LAFWHRTARLAVGVGAVLVVGWLAMFALATMGASRVGGFDQYDWRDGSVAYLENTDPRPQQCTVRADDGAAYRIDLPADTGWLRGLALSGRTLHRTGTGVITLTCEGHASVTTGWLVRLYPAAEPPMPAVAVALLLAGSVGARVCAHVTRAGPAGR